MRTTFGLQAPRLAEGLLTVRRLARYLDVLFCVEDHPEAGAYERLVVDDENADTAAGGRIPVFVRRHEVIDPHRALEVLEPLLAEIDEREVLVLEHRVGGLRDENLAPDSCGTDARCSVDGEPVVLVRGDRRLACVDSHAHARLDPVGPVVPGERLLRGQRRERGVLGAPEGDEERIALRADALAAGVLEDGAQHTVVLGEHVSVLVPQLPDQRGRAFDIGEEEGVGPGQASGSLACNRYPPSGRGPASSSPP